MQIQIEGNSYLALIDTGSALSFLRKDVLVEIETKFHVSNSECINIYGKKYFSSNFQIPQVKIGDFISETVFKEEDEALFTDCVLGSPLTSWKIYLMYQVFREAIIGMNVFQNFACIFDFPHSSIFLANEMSEIIENEDFSTAEFYSVPFEMGKTGAILLFETDLGKKKLLLDAGSTFSMIRFTDEEKAIYTHHTSSKKFTSNTLSINGLDLGEWTFRVMDIAGEMNDMDGFLGIEFFNKNIICLDFSKGVAHIQHPKLGSKERFNYWLKSYFGK